MTEERPVENISYKPLFFAFMVLAGPIGLNLGRSLGAGLLAEGQALSVGGSVMGCTVLGAVLGWLAVAQINRRLLSKWAKTGYAWGVGMAGVVLYFFLYVITTQSGSAGKPQTLAPPVRNSPLSQSDLPLSTQAIPKGTALSSPAVKVPQAEPSPDKLFIPRSTVQQSPEFQALPPVKQDAGLVPPNPARAKREAGESANIRERQYQEAVEALRPRTGPSHSWAEISQSPEFQARSAASQERITRNFGKQYGTKDPTFKQGLLGIIPQGPLPTIGSLLTPSTETPQAAQFGTLLGPPHKRALHLGTLIGAAPKEGDRSSAE